MPASLELAAILVVHLVTMAMALVDDFLTIDIKCLGTLFELAQGMRPKRMVPPFSSISF